MAIFMDRTTGRIRGIYRDEDVTRAAAVAVSADAAASVNAALAGRPDVEVIVSYGLPGIVPN